jgi:hypothetical protein
VTPSKTDANQKEIVAALRKAGAFVQSLHTVGDGCADLLIRHRGLWIVKDVKAPKYLRWTDDQLVWWRKAGLEPEAIQSVEDALRIIGAVK